MEFRYELLVNVAWTTDENRHPAATGYHDGDLMVPTWRSTIVADTLEGAAGQVYARHNRDDRPDGAVGPSMSVGDVVIVHDNATSHAFAVGRNGFMPVAPPENVERDRPWSDLT